MHDERTSKFVKVLNELVVPKGMVPDYLSADEYPAVVLDDSHAYTAPYVFEDCTGSPARFFLKCFLSGSPLCEWKLACQLVKSAATRGALVMQDATAVIDSEDWLGVNPRQLLLSFIAIFPGFKVRLPKLLATSLPDFRDGLFIACKFTNDPEADLILRPSPQNGQDLSTGRLLLSARLNGEISLLRKPSCERRRIVE